MTITREKFTELAHNRIPFVLATVVVCDNPTSAKPGAKAIVLQDGTVYGWVGGSCTQPIVIREALNALQDGLPKLLKIGAEEALRYGQGNGVLNFEMTCYSGGTMEIFIEPVLPSEHLILIGNSPDLQALARLGAIMNFSVTVCDADLPAEAFAADVPRHAAFQADLVQNVKQTWVVVATHGRYDEDALLTVLRTGVHYVGLIASKKRASAIFDYLRSKGFSDTDLAAIKVPAGLDIGARTPDEIALSILAEIVQKLRTVTEPGQVAEPVITEAEAKDPVCGMSVNRATARFQTEFQGEAFYFCCSGCLQKFESNPKKYFHERAH